VVDQLRDLRSQLRRVGRAGTGDQNQDRVVHPLRVVLEQPLKGLQLRHNALGRVQLVPADQNLLVLVELPERSNVGLDARLGPVDLDAHRVDANGAVDDLGDAALVIDVALGGRLVAHDADSRGEEVAAVGPGLEAAEVGAEEAVEDGLAPGQAAEHLGRGEGRVQEEADGRVWNAGAEDARDQGCPRFRARTTSRTHILRW
jgi:hypothetical protein